MIRGRIGRVRRGGDDGAILIIAIAIVTVVALVTGAVLTRGDGSLRATVALRAVAGSTYAADGAAQVAINALRTGYSPADPNGPIADNEWAFNNDPFDGCFGVDASGNPVNTLELFSPVEEPTNDPSNDFYPPTGRQDAPTSATVVCEPEDDTGTQGSPVPINDSNRPGNAILTLGTGGETGLFAKPQGDTIGQFRVQGGIWSNSNIVAEIGSIRSTSYIRAASGCNPQDKMIAPDVNCSAQTVADPGYASEAGGVVPPHRRPPTNCNDPDNVVEFLPGYYDDARALAAITNSNVNACKDNTWWFHPGVYYFDFHNASDDPQSLNDLMGADNSNPTQWTVGNGTLLAGTPTGSLVNPSVPGACDNPVDPVDPENPESQEGVQFIFGGESQLKVDGTAQNAAKVEICGTFDTGRPPIALYGLKEGAATPTQLIGSDARTATNVAATNNTFTNATPAALEQTGGAQASWTKTTSGTQTATITMNGFAPPTAIPAGSVLTAATLHITHSEATTDSRVTIDPDGATPAFTQAITLPRRTTSQTDSINLATYNSTLWTALRREVHDNGFSGARLDYAATLAQNETATLDAVRLELTYYVPQFRAQTDAGYGATNCLVVGRTCSGGAPGALLSTPTNYAGQLYLQGTTYAPLTKLDLNLSGQVTSQVLRFGVIARALSIRETGSFSYEGPVIELPGGSYDWGTKATIVQLKVYVCPGQETCSTSDELALKVRVQLWDPGGVPDPPQREVTVLSWSQQR